MVEGMHSVTQNTPSNILFGAGTYHRDMSFDKTTQKLTTGTTLGATQGGGGLEIKGEIVPLELDGALVAFEGQDIMCGGAGIIEATYAEITPENVAMGIIGSVEAGEGYSIVKPKANIEKGDYVEGFGFVGFTADKKRKIAVIMESAICTSGFKLEPKNKEQASVKLTMEARAKIEGNLDTIPVTVIFLG